MAFCLKMKSDYSFLSSTITFDDAISFCKQNHLTYCSLIDNNLHGALDFYTLCIKNSLMPILGVELKVKYNDDIYPLNFIAKSELGYKNISRLTSLANKYQQNYIEFKSLALYSQDVILVISSEDSYLKFLIENNKIYEANEFIDTIKSVFKEYYLGVYRYQGSNNVLINSIKEYCNQIDIKSIAMQYATHKDEKDTVILNLLDCISKNIPANKDFLQVNSIKESYLKKEELLKIYYDVEELNNLMNMAKDISLKINKVDFSLPSLYENANSKLEELALSALKGKGLLDEKYVSRANYELSVINKMGFANYYLIVADYVNYAKNNNIPVGPARGSGAASLIAYLLNITTIDPIKYDLLFERFLNPSRINYPDFDIDFADIKRDEIINYAKEKYGYRHVGHIATYSTFGIKSSIRDLARTLRMGNDDVDAIMKTLSANPISINHEYNNNMKFKNLLDIHGNYKTLCTLASKIEGLKKQSGLHAAGMILSSTPLDELVPCFEVNENTLAIQYDYINAEKVGLIKMDFLGLKNLTIIEYCLNKINTRYKTNYTIDNFPYDDSYTYELISSGDTIGLFQLESEGINNVINKLKPNCFNDIVALIALYRPGPMDMIQTYIDRKNGKEFKYVDDCLIDILKDTYGIIIYQEQIMQICQRVASYSLGDADILRRAISKKNLTIIKNEKEKFVKGCLNNGFDINKANLLFSYIEKFASYGFNKAHSVGYGKITCMMAYIKAHYKSIFYEALLNVNQESGERRKKIFYEIKKNNITINKPNILLSDYDFISDESSITYGLTNISTIKDNVASIIINERNNESFNDIYDFVIRMVKHDVSMQMIDDLIYAGALDCFNIERSKLIANMNSLYNFASMFKGMDYLPNSYKDEKYSFFNIPLFLKDDLETDYLKKEYDMLGIYLSTHPISKIKKSMDKQFSNIVDINEDGHYNIVGKITLIEFKKTKNDKPYISINLEDETKLINVKEYNNANKYKELFKKGDIISANITIKNNYAYLNYANKVEVNK